MSKLIRKGIGPRGLGASPLKQTLQNADKKEPEVVATNVKVSNVSKMELENKNEKSKEKFRSTTYSTSDNSADKLKMKHKSGVGLTGNREVNKVIYKGVKKEDDGTYTLSRNRNVNGRNTRSHTREISEKRYERIKKRINKRGDKQIDQYKK